jgi:hypothetical protein
MDAPEKAALQPAPSGEPGGIADRSAGGGCGGDEVTTLRAQAQLLIYLPTRSLASTRE